MIDEFDRVLTTPGHYAYLRIAEGCDNRCAYCVIPSLRGRYRSRRMEDVLAEARKLADAGVKECIVIAQDITRYGIDLYGEQKLAALLRELCKLNFHWIRLHYLYPDEFTDELIDTIAAEDKVLPYLDIPIQHCNDKVLRAMNRRGDKAELLALFRELRGAHSRSGAAHQPDHRPALRGRGRLRGAVRVPAGGAHRAGGRVPLLPGGGDAGGAGC